MIVAYCVLGCMFVFFKQKTAYEMRISDWSSDVCSSDLDPDRPVRPARVRGDPPGAAPAAASAEDRGLGAAGAAHPEGERCVSAPPAGEEIGRASGRERVCQAV